MTAVPDTSTDGGQLSPTGSRSFRDEMGRYRRRATRWPDGVIASMYDGHRIGLVIPVYNEAPFVGDVLDGLPAYLDRVYVVDDCSTDGTWAVVQQRAGARDDARTAGTSQPAPTADGGSTLDGRLVPIRHESNRGRGGAVKTGYAAALSDDVDVVAVMDGDGQMDPETLARIVEPVTSGVADYAKGDRLRRPGDRREMSGWRLFGNLLLTGLTRVASGYYGMRDSQNGFTAISRETLASLDLDGLYDGYGFLNDVLVQLNERDARIADVRMAARYGDEESGIAYRTFVPFLSVLLVHRFVRRLWVTDRAVSRRPVGLCYGLAALVAGVGVVLSVATGLAGATATGTPWSGTTVAWWTLAVSVLLVLFATAMDRRRNRRLVSVLGGDRPVGDR